MIIIIMSMMMIVIINMLSTIIVIYRNYSEKSVSKAWQNVEDHYLTIGMLEDVPLFMETLEYLMPQMFSDINNAYLSVGRFDVLQVRTGFNSYSNCHI